MKFLLTQDRMQPEISKRYSYSFRRMSAKLHEEIGYQEYSLLLFWQLAQLKKFCGTFLKVF